VLSILVVQMRSPAFWRRSSTAAGIYLSVLIGFVGTVVAVRELGIYGFGLLSIVLAAAGFFQLFADLTVEEAVVKYGFRYAVREDWGRFRRLFRVGLELKLVAGVLAAAAVALLAPFSHLIWAKGLTTPLLIAALLPLAQAPQSVAAAALTVRGRYDVRAGFLVVAMTLRLAALAVGGVFGVVETVIALVVAQALTTVLVGAVAIRALGAFPRPPAVPLGDDRAPFRSFVVRSSLGSVLAPMRTLLGTLLLGVVTGPQQVAYFRVAQAPESAFAALSSPARLILLTEQTEDFERGRDNLAYRTLRRYIVGAGVAALVLLPPLALLMPTLLEIVYGAGAAPATDAARLFLLVAGIQVLLGWAKSFPISIGRPELRLYAQGAEILVLLPMLLVFGSAYGATGAAAAFVLGSLAFAGVWIVLLMRLRRERRRGRGSPSPVDARAS
jgi:O-antigen/teichoic acid export membrane protein